MPNVLKLNQHRVTVAPLDCHEELIQQLIVGVTSQPPASGKAHTRRSLHQYEAEEWLSTF